MQFSHQNADFRSTVARRQQLRVRAASYSPGGLYGMLRPACPIFTKSTDCWNNSLSLPPKAHSALLTMLFLEAKGSDGATWCWAS